VTEDKHLLLSSDSLLYESHHSSTPTVALSTHLFMKGNPIIAFTTGIIDDDLHNNMDKQILERQNAKRYSITKPPIYKPTQGKLMKKFKT